LESIGKDGKFAEYLDSKTADYKRMVEEIRKRIGFTTLHFLTLEEMVKAVIEAPNNTNLKKEDLCMYCWTGKV
jgi:amidophosphoribosyltransferase